MNTFKKAYLVANLAIYAGFAAAFLAIPRALGASLGIRLESAAALADFRAMYGGLSLGTTVLIARALRDRTFEQPAMVLSISCAGGLLFGRLLTLATDGPGSAFIYASMVSEAVAFVVGLALLKTGESVAHEARA